MRRLRQASNSTLDRDGTTLSEVLISLLVMSVGVVSLATLFPISVLRSVQATQLTNATNLRFNAQEMARAVPQIRTVGQSWEARKAYSQNAWVVPSVDSPLTNYSLIAQCTTAGTSDAKEPNWLLSNTITEGGANPPTWQVYRLHNYIVDPQGEYVATYDDPTAMGRGISGGPHVFGNDPTSYGFVSNIRAFPGLNFNSTTPGTPSLFDNYQAAALCTLPDSWILQSESTALSSYTAGALSLTLTDLKDDLTATTPIPSGLSDALLPSRIVLFDVSGKFSCVRPITQITGTPPSQTISWSSSSGALPTVKQDGTAFVPVRARVETAERRFTWMLSVRQGSPSMDVVVFFRRKYSSKDEQVYPATFQTGPIDPNSSDPANNIWTFYPSDPGYDAAPGILNVDDDGVNGTDDIGERGYPGSDDAPRSWVVIQYDPTGEKPFYKKGGFVTDATNLQWYRITDIVEGDAFYGYKPVDVMKKAGIPTSAVNMPTYVPDAAISGYQAVVLRLERPIAISGSPPSGGAGGVPTGGAIFMRSVVDVFPVSTR